MTAASCRFEWCTTRHGSEFIVTDEDDDHMSDGATADHDGHDVAIGLWADRNDDEPHVLIEDGSTRLTLHPVLARALFDAAAQDPDLAFLFGRAPLPS